MRTTAFLLTALLFLTLRAGAQNTIGIPNITNYLKQDYNAGRQNWAIAQDKHGIMYFGNNNGLLSFDGAFWRTYPLPNATIVRSIAIDADERIYVGGQGEFGYFFPGKNGELEYTSLKKMLPPAEFDFADVWNVCLFNKEIFFRANRKIIRFANNKLTTWNGVNFNFMGNSSNHLIAYDNQEGMLSFLNGKWVRKIRTGVLPAGIQFKNAIDFGKDSTLLTSISHGLFIIHNDSLYRFETPDIKNIAAMNIFGAIWLSPDKLALPTNLGGCAVVSKSGNFIQRFTKKEGIQNNNVLSIFLDKDENLWLGLDNGIDLLTYSNSIKNIFPETDDRNSGYTSYVHNGHLYLGLASGLFSVPLARLDEDLSYTKGVFSLVDKTKGQVWNLSEVNGQLLMGHNKGAFHIHSNTASVIDSKSGFWLFKPVYDSVPSSLIMAGSYNGINFYHYANGRFSNPEKSVHFESARFIEQHNNKVWAIHPYKGLYKISIGKDGNASVADYPDRKKLLSENHNHIYSIGGKLVLTSDNGIFEYNDKEEDFVESARFRALFGNTVVDYLKEDHYGNIWFCTNRKLGVVDRSSGKPALMYIPELDDKILANGFEHINVVDSNNVFIAAEKGFFHLNYARYKKAKYPLKTLIRKMSSANREKPLIFGGYPTASETETPSIKYDDNSIHFECTSILYGQKHNTEYSYFLEGFDRNWGEWTKKTEKEYTNLPAGSYTFRVKSRNNFDNESPVTSYRFTILPPWYQTWWAWLLYSAAFFGILYLFYKRQQEKYKRRERKKLEEQQRRYAEEQQQLRMLHELEIGKSEKQIIELKNEKLQAELEHKNAELASSAMNLVRKKEFLTKVRTDLSDYRSNADPQKAGKEFQKIVKMIENELDHDQEWEQFARHFDSVHTNYLARLKEFCPDLTSSELKLAAYLRLNLSTKEIAQLMNISIRGVETSRYRLRKKLNLTTNDTSLFDFLINITKITEHPDQ
ncbi:MAG: ligand-binding sensor domain-containing protein [Chitinophagaceae bacterium]